MSYDKIEKVSKVDTEKSYFRYAFKLGKKYYGVHTGKLLRQGVWNHANHFEELKIGRLKDRHLNFNSIENFKGYGVYPNEAKAKAGLNAAAGKQKFRTAILEVKIKGRIRKAYTILGDCEILIANHLKIIGEIT